MNVSIRSLSGGLGLLLLSLAMPAWAMDDADHAVDSRILVRSLGTPFQTHYPVFLPVRGSSCRNMKKYFAKKLAPVFNNNPLLQAHDIQIGLSDCKEVQNTLTRGSPLEIQLEMAPYLEGRCPRPPVVFYTKPIDSTVDIDDHSQAFLRSLGIQFVLVPKAQILSLVLTNQMKVTVSGCEVVRPAPVSKENEEAN